MIQQINLYQGSGTKERHILLNPYLGLLLLCCLTLGGISFKQIQTLHATQAQQQQLNKQLAEARIRLESLQKKYPSRQLDNLLNQELQQYQNLQQSLSHVLERLAEDQSDHSLGFSRYLAALAEQANSQVWLSEIHIDSGTELLELKGSTYKPEQIALMLQQLQNTSAFKGRHFSKLNIQQHSNAEEQVDFNVSSTPKSDVDPSHDRKH